LRLEFGVRVKKPAKRKARVLAGAKTAKAKSANVKVADRKAAAAKVASAKAAAAKAGTKHGQRNRAARRQATVAAGKWAAGADDRDAIRRQTEPPVGARDPRKIWNRHKVAASIAALASFAATLPLIWPLIASEPTRADLIAATPSITAERLDDHTMIATGERLSRADQSRLVTLAAIEPDDTAAYAQPDTFLDTTDRDAGTVERRERSCALEDAAQSPFALAQPNMSLGASLDPQFGIKLAKFAEAQTREFVVYTDKYQTISYPMGDVSALFGVCTDVVVRAYRSLGIDLQERVKQSRAGTGDPNIDHRRTEVLRRFFARAGESFIASNYPEDYRPGDIVTYYRPQNQGSRSHIAIISTKRGRSGRPMIVHNRGWGPQIEDALFVDRITGHYRYRGEMPATLLAASKAKASDKAKRVRAVLKRAHKKSVSRNAKKAAAVKAAPKLTKSASN
jgi:uncharacterized protein YijF (DUF1287 family)